MISNAKVASLLEEKLHIENCPASDSITEHFMAVVDSLSETRATIIKMRYGLNDEGYQHKWPNILKEINDKNKDYPCTMHRIKDLEQKAWLNIRKSIRPLTEFDVLCLQLNKLIMKGE